jgi:Spy/CpxP family protein refolding chaperone
MYGRRGKSRHKQTKTTENSMKLTKISLIAMLAVATVLSYNSAFAQDAKDGKDAQKKRGGDFVKQRMDTLTEELKLTDAQKPKVEAALTAQAEKMRGLRDATPEERQEKMKASREEMSKKMKEILTAEQFEKYEKAAPTGSRPRRRQEETRRRREVISAVKQPIQRGAAHSRPSFLATPDCQQKHATHLSPSLAGASAVANARLTGFLNSQTLP